MTRSRTRPIGQTVLTLAIVCLLMTTDTRAQLQESSATSSSLMFASRHRTKSTTDTMTTELRLPSETRATFLSTAFTVVPTAVGLALATSGDDNVGLGVGIAGFGLFFGPSIGYFYGDCSNRGMTGVGVRSLVALGTGVIAVIVSHTHKSEGWMDFGGLEAAAKVCAVGAGVIAVLCLYDISRVHDTVEKQNRHRRLSSVRLNPSLSADGQTWGIELSLAF